MVNPDPKFQDKQRYVRITLRGFGSCISTPAAAADMIGEKDPGSDDEYAVENVWMTPHEFENLPEFQGF
jgi:hypothetical protein